MKYANYSVRHAAVMKQDDVLFLLVVRIQQLSAAARGRRRQAGRGRRSKYANSAR